MRTYKKKPLLYREQIDLLKSRGLTFADEEKAIQYLQEISYYRLSAYCIPFQKEKDVYNSTTSFENIIDLYLFDRELRMLVFDSIERIEIAIRAQMIYIMSHKYNDSHWQDNSSLFRMPYTNIRTGKTYHIFADIQNSIKKQLDAKHPEVFIKHYKLSYNDPQNPPSWMSIELLSIGELSRLYTDIKENSDRKDIASFFGLHHSVFTSWLHTIVYVRNICAHHGRLWNREFAIKPEILRNPSQNWIQAKFNSNSHRTFYFLCILKYLLKSASPSNHFKTKLEKLFAKYPTLPIQFLGIPTNDEGTLVEWRNEPVWQK